MLFNQSNFYWFEETSSYWSFYFFSAFNWSPSLGNSCVSGIFYVSKLQYHEVSLVTINQQTSYDFGILRQDDRIVKCLPMNQMRFADYVTISVVHLPKGWAELPHRTRLCGPCIAALAGFYLRSIHLNKYSTNGFVSS